MYFHISYTCIAYMPHVTSISHSCQVMILCTYQLCLLLCSNIFVSIIASVR
jgi:hypothetical protein